MIYLVGNHRSSAHECRIRVCDTFWTRLLGALPEGGIENTEGVLLPGCRRIHTWFMRKSISVMFLTGDGRVTRYHPRVRPFRVLSGGPRSRITLELAPDRLDLEVRSEVDVQLRLDPSTALRAGMPGWALDKNDREKTVQLRNGT